MSDSTSARSWANEQSASTRRQLIVAAIHLMAEDGIDGVSLRAVNVNAGARNASAAHYHFGNKLGLVRAIVDTLAEYVARVRKPYIDELRKRAKSETLDVREIVEAAYLPFYSLYYHPDFNLPAVKFLSRLIVDTAPDVRVLANRFTEPLANDVYELLAPVLPDVPETLLKTRLIFSLTNLIHGASDVLAMEHSPFGDMRYRYPIELASHFIDYVVAGISAPAGTLDDRFNEVCLSMLRSKPNPKDA